MFNHTQDYNSTLARFLHEKVYITSIAEEKPWRYGKPVKINLLRSSPKLVIYAKTYRKLPEQADPLNSLGIDLLHPDPGCLYGWGLKLLYNVK